MPLGRVPRSLVPPLQRWPGLTWMAKGTSVPWGLSHNRRAGRPRTGAAVYAVDRDLRPGSMSARKMVPLWGSYRHKKNTSAPSATSLSSHNPHPTPALELSGRGACTKASVWRPHHPRMSRNEVQLNPSLYNLSPGFPASWTSQHPLHSLSPSWCLLSISTQRWLVVFRYE